MMEASDLARANGGASAENRPRSKNESCLCLAERMPDIDESGREYGTHVRSCGMSPVVLGPEGNPYVYYPHITKKTKVHKDVWHAELGKLPRKREAIGKLVVGISGDGNRGGGVGVGGSGLVDRCSDTFVVFP